MSRITHRRPSVPVQFSSSRRVPRTFETREKLAVVMATINDADEPNNCRSAENRDQKRDHKDGQQLCPEMRVGISADLLLRLMSSGAVCASDLRCLDCPSHQCLRGLCLKSCAANLHRDVHLIEVDQLPATPTTLERNAES